MILDGKALAATLRSETAQETAQFIQQTGVTPCLAAILVGDDPASQVYVRNKEIACQKAGIKSVLHKLPAETTQEELEALIDQLNADPEISGILCQLPLPRGLNETAILDRISPDKDVDAFHPENVGRILQGRPRFLPCTPAGIMELIRRNNIETKGKNAVVLGRSDIVGKPMAALLMQKGVDATVTVCHSRTSNLADVTRAAEILIVAIGKPKFVTADMVGDGAVVIDVGINRTESGLVGDVDFDAVAPLCSHITPVSGGVGPMTIVSLMQNTLMAAKHTIYPA